MAYDRQQTRKSFSGIGGNENWDLRERILVHNPLECGFSGAQDINVFEEQNTRIELPRQYLRVKRHSSGCETLRDIKRSLSLKKVSFLLSRVQNINFRCGVPWGNTRCSSSGVYEGWGLYKGVYRDQKKGGGALREKEEKQYSRISKRKSERR